MWQPVADRRSPVFLVSRRFDRDAVFGGDGHQHSNLRHASRGGHSHRISAPAESPCLTQATPLRVASANFAAPLVSLAYQDCASHNPVRSGSGRIWAPAPPAPKTASGHRHAIDQQLGRQPGRAVDWQGLLRDIQDENTPSYPVCSRYKDLIVVAVHYQDGNVERLQRLGIPMHQCRGIIQSRQPGSSVNVHPRRALLRARPGAIAEPAMWRR